MTNNKSITILFFCLFFNSVIINAQESDEATVHDDVWGFNVTAFANQFFSLNGNEAHQGAYLITYKKVNDKVAFRLGFNVDVNRVSGDEGNSNVPFDQTTMAYDLRLGGEKRHDIGKRWLFTTGADAILGATFTKFESSNNFNTGEQKDNNFLLGLGPVLGVHFRFNQRISIGTESTLYLSYSRREQSFSDGFSGSTDTAKTSVVDLNISPPIALFFSIRI